jgi:hypothetical protein
VGKVPETYTTGIVYHPVLLVTSPLMVKILTVVPDGEAEVI